MNDCFAYVGAVVWCLWMVSQVTMWAMEGDFVVPQYYNTLKIFEKETYASLRVCLKEKLALE